MQFQLLMSTTQLALVKMLVIDININFSRQSKFVSTIQFLLVEILIVDLYSRS